jgi:hypothetical protein
MHFLSFLGVFSPFPRPRSGPGRRVSDSPSQALQNGGLESSGGEADVRGKFTEAAAEGGIQ